MAGFRGRDHRTETIGPCDLLGDLGIENAGSGLLPDLLVLFPGQLEAFVIGLDANGRVTVLREVVIDVLDDGFLSRREIADIPEACDDLVALLEQGIVDELEVPVGDRQFQDVEFLLVVLEDERSDLLRDIRREGLPSIWIRKVGLKVSISMRRSPVGPPEGRTPPDTYRRAARGVGMDASGGSVQKPHADVFRRGDA
jgi:hypothetical protein